MGGWGGTVCTHGDKDTIDVDVLGHRVTITETLKAAVSKEENATIHKGKEDSW